MSVRALSQLMVAAALLMGAGCARFEYVLLEPGDGEQLIPRDQRLVVPQEPMTYRLGRVDDRLLVRVANPTDEPIRIVGEGSYVVDPEGETHPIGGGTIAPHAYIDLILPPPPYVYRGYAGYHFGAGFGRWHGYRGYGWGYPYCGFYDPWWYEPSMYTVEVYGPYHWDWRTGTVRLHLAYERGGQRFEQTLAVLRRRAS